MELQNLVADGQLFVASLVALAAGLLSFLSPCVLPLVPGYLAYVGATAASARSDDGRRAAATAAAQGAERGVATAGGAQKEARSVSSRRPLGPLPESARSDDGRRGAATAAAQKGERGTTTSTRTPRARTVGGILLFVAGFSAVFVAMTALAGSVGVWLMRWEEPITRVMGVIVIVMGLVFIGLFGGMQRTAKLKLKPRVGLVGAPLLGIVFGVGWTPCMGPTLAVIMTLGLQTESAGRAAILGLAYCLGLGLPFVLAGFGFGWMTQATNFMKRHIRAVNVIGGVLLILIGLLMVTGLWTQLMYAMQAVIGSFVPAL